MTVPRRRLPGSSGNALVLAGGGVAGTAWELGVLCSIADADRRSPAGSSPPISSSAPQPEQRSRGRSPAAFRSTSCTRPSCVPKPPRSRSTSDKDKLFADFDAVMTNASGPEDSGRRMGAIALAATIADPTARLATIAARLPVKHWPDRRILVTAVDAEIGAVTVFTRESGVTLVDAVAASSAVPGVWAPVVIGGRSYIDGGVRSMNNADLAAGADRVLIIQPTLEGPPTRGAASTPRSPPWPRPAST